MKQLLPLTLLLSAWVTSAPAQDPQNVRDGAPAYKPLFDGKTFTGWEGDTQQTWRIEEGAITAGSLEVTVPRNEFLATTREFENFDLRLKYKIVGTEGFVNGGVQFRTRRIPNHHEVIGYQADLGMGYDGALYDESRRKTMLAKPSEEIFRKAFRPGDWNEYRIRAEGAHINIWLNGIRTVDYAEQDPDIAQTGIIAVQIHGNGKTIVQYKDIEIQELPPIKAVNRFGDPQDPVRPREAFPGQRFSLQPGDVVVFTGQTDIVRARHSGHLESLLAVQFADAQPVFRNMAWEGDTVYEQWRDLNFGTWIDQLRSVHATVILAQFGQMEALEGPDRIEAFIASYEKLLDQFAQQTRSVVLISPRPFERPRSPHMPDHSGENGTVRQYVDAIRSLAVQRGAVFVDLFSPFAEGRTELTDNGVHLTPEGQTVVGIEIARQLGSTGGEHSGMEALRAAIREKNRLWFDNFRPMNWTFAFGDRTEQPFGRPGGDSPSLRIELQEFKPLLQAADKRIHEIALAVNAGHPPQSAVREPAHTSVPRSEPVAETADHSVQAELDSFTVLDGFEVNLFASEADGAVKPLQMKWDDQGRLWVLCAPTYPHIEPGAVPRDYILVCEDTNGDGRADRFSRFAEGLFIAMGMEFGDGGVYLAEGTELVHLKDTDGDGKADSRTVLLSGFGTADSHQMINGLSWGPGGELWFTQGHHVYSHVETPWGISRLHKSGVWRYGTRTGRLDGFFNMSTAGLNCQGVAADSWGQIFHNSGAYSGGFYTVPGMISTLRPLQYWAMAVPDRRNTGIEFIGTRHLPDELQDCVVWGGFMSNTVQLHQLVDEGSGFTARVLPDLVKSSRREFRPINVRIGPDGAIYVCDWYNAVIGHYQASYRDPTRDRTHGRIWRITAKGRLLVRQPDLSAMTPGQLVDQLRSPERLTRYNAKRRLFDLPAETAVSAADAWIGALDVNDPDYERLLVEAAGIYEAHETVRPNLLQKLLAARDGRARAYGTRMVGHWADRLRDPLNLLRASIRDEHPRVRLEAIVACSGVKSPQAIEVAAQAVEMPRDRFIDYALSQAVSALKPYWSPALARGELHFDHQPQRLQFVLEADGTRDVANLVRQLSQNPDLPEEARNHLLALLANVGDAKDLRFALDHGSRSPIVLNELAAVAAVHHRRPQGDLVESIQALLNEPDPVLQAAAVRLAGLWQLRSLAPEVREQLSRSETPALVIQAALASLVQLEGRDALPAIKPFAAPEKSPDVASAAVSAIASVDLAQAARLAAQLMPQIPSEADMAQLLAPLLGRRGGSDALAADLRNVRLGPDPAKLALRVLSGAGRGDPALVDVLNQASGIRAGKLEYDSALVQELAAAAGSQGDARQGRDLFLSKLANCTACHKLSGQGGDIGPDLTIVGAGRSPELLVESVLWPNRQIREGFMSTKIMTDDGQLFIGYKLKESEEEILLRETSTNQVRRIARSSIEQMADAGSVMPEGLTASMTRDELVSLIRFLTELGKEK